MSRFIDTTVLEPIEAEQALKNLWDNHHPEPKAIVNAPSASGVLGPSLYDIQLDAKLNKLVFTVQTPSHGVQIMLTDDPSKAIIIGVPNHSEALRVATSIRSALKNIIVSLR